MLIDIATASPPYKVSQHKATEELKKRMAVGPAIGRLIDAASNHSGIESRYVVLPDADENAEKKFFTSADGYVNPDTKRRMEEYEYWSKRLTAEAVSRLAANINYDLNRVDRLITISCTGFFAPGLDYHLMNEFNMRKSVKRTNIGFMGCAASLIGFNSVLEAMNSTVDASTETLMVSVELCSLHLQTEPTRDNILANMIFADGAAAALFSARGDNSVKGKLELLSTRSILFDNSAEFMGWKIGSYGFEMMLSSELPKIILEKAVPALNGILKDLGIEKGAIKHWALHPGGRAVLDSLQNGLMLSEKEMASSRTVLKNYGNMSSATILFVLKEMFETETILKDELCCAVAFGPGLTMEVALMKGV